MLQVIHTRAVRQSTIWTGATSPKPTGADVCRPCSKAEREAVFELLNRAPFHLRLIRVGEARYWFMMSNHHILIDAWCRSLLMNDFFRNL